MEKNQLITIVVSEVHVWGVVAAFNNLRVLVLIPEVSWVASFSSCEEFCDPGDVICVRVLHVDDNGKDVYASIKRVYSDPWTTGVLSTGRVLLAKFRRRIASASRCGGDAADLLEAVPGGYVVVCGNSKSFKASEEVYVYIKEANPEKWSLLVVQCQNPPTN